MTTAGYVVFVLFIISPFLPLAVAAVVTFRRNRHFNRDVVLLVALTTLSVLAVAGFFAKSVIGPDYSVRRYVTIYCSLAITVLLAIITMRRKNELSKPMFMSSALLAAVWLFHAAISSVV